jgi:hypothetical protein
MNKFVCDLKQMILGCDPYDAFPWKDYENDLTGGEIYPIFEEAIKALKPHLIVEVGSWKGKSAVHMAKLAKQFDDEVIVLCIDTWLGSDMVHQFAHKNDDIWGMRKLYNRGYPTMYFQFLANVCYEGLQDTIVPFPNVSSVAAQWLSQQTFQADIVYIDGCHDEDGCYLDLHHYWPIVRDGGVMFGDDFSALWYPVICAVNRFAKENGLKLMIAPGDKWVLQKTV